MRMASNMICGDDADDEDGNDDDGDAYDNASKNQHPATP